MDCGKEKPACFFATGYRVIRQSRTIAGCPVKPAIPHAPALAAIGTLNAKLRARMPDIIMGDRLHFNEPIAMKIRSKGAHFLIKVTTAPKWR